MDDFGQLIEPAPVKFQFTAPGWYVLGGLLILAILMIAWIWWRHYRANLYRKMALQTLSGMQNTYMEQNTAILVYETNMLLKRIAISRYGRIPFAGSMGGEWIACLNETWKEKSFDPGDQKILQTIYPLQGIPVADGKAFVEKARRWIKTHRRVLNNKRRHAF